MATVSAKIYEHHRKADGTFNVKICIHHNGQRKFIDTDHFVVKKQLTATFKIKDRFLLDLIEQQLRDYRKSISELGGRLDHFTAEELRNYLRDKDEDIDIIKFCRVYIDQLRTAGRNGSADNHRTVVNSLIDYFKRPVASINEINSAMLINYERFLRSERKLTRINQLGKHVTIQKAGLTDSGLYNHMRDLRTMFNAARNLYNDADLGIIRIKHYPFAKYKLSSPPITRKRNNSPEQVRLIRDCESVPGGRLELARDIYMLSLYLCGMNAVDLYYLKKSNINNGRIDYQRSKTKGKRRDKAFISIKIVDEAKPLLDKYIERISQRYSSYDTFDTALSIGMKALRQKTGIDDVTIYWARHTFATIARNRCRLSKDDIAMAINHVDGDFRTTDIYLEKDWIIVDDVQHKVLRVITINNDSRECLHQITESNIVIAENHRN